MVVKEAVRPGGVVSASAQELGRGGGSRCTRGGCLNVTLLLVDYRCCEQGITAILPCCASQIQIPAHLAASLPNAAGFPPSPWPRLAGALSARGSDARFPNVRVQLRAAVPTTESAGSSTEPSITAQRSKPGTAARRDLLGHVPVREQRRLQRPAAPAVSPGPSRFHQLAASGWPSALAG